ncbi:MAG: lamin tail domain-containing protein, partial [candidate division Zixibacteria bacterium]|nr:lamin tail domain-containing protein [candidate division Zixibacteria bacterium]
MNKAIQVLILVLIVSLFAPGLSAKVVVNEVMANEPSGSTILEWIELFVDSSGSVSMNSYEVIIGDKLVTFPSGLVLNPDEYYIICRKLTAMDNTASFEGRWGDSSGYWGDTSEETALRTPHEAVFSLVNAGGSVKLYRNLSQVSELIWTQEGQDGFSWERTSPKSDLISQSVDIEGSTPGVINSLTPVDYDLALESVNAVSEESLTSLTFSLANRGLSRVVGAQLFLYIGEETTPLDIIELPNLSADDIDSVSGHYTLDGLYIDMRAVLSDDDRNRNNYLDLVAPGIDYPPFILTEVMANPQSGSTSEWVEIRNLLNQPWDLSGWQVGDSKTLHLVTDTSIILELQERAVLVRSKHDFENYYPDFTGRLIEPQGWSQLNNTGDTLRLIDQYGLEADRFGYDSIFEESHTWSRGETNPYENKWGR